jgi:hypothetical protein
MTVRRHEHGQPPSRAPSSDQDRIAGSPCSPRPGNHCTPPDCRPSAVTVTGCVASTRVEDRDPRRGDTGRHRTPRPAHQAGIPVNGDNRAPHAPYPVSGGGGRSRRTVAPLAASYRVEDGHGLARQGTAGQGHSGKPGARLAPRTSRPGRGRSAAFPDQRPPSTPVPYHPERQPADDTYRCSPVQLSGRSFRFDAVSHSAGWRHRRSGWSDATSVSDFEPLLR